MRLFDFVKEYDRIGAAADLLSELAAFFVADVAGGRADQAGDGVLFHVFRHIDAYQCVFVVKQKLCEGAGQFSLADAGGAEENEAADGPLGIAETGAGAADGVGHALQGRVLADHAIAQAFFHLDQLLDLAFEHPGDGDAGPLGDDAGDVFFVHFFFEHAGLALAVGLGGELVQFVLGLAEQAVADFGHTLQVASAFFGLLFDFELLDLFFERTRAGDQVFLFFPVGLERVGFLADPGEFFFNNP